jgi:hypothetical protein
VQQLKKIPALERRSCDLPRGRRGAAAGAPAARRARGRARPPPPAGARAVVPLLLLH